MFDLLKIITEMFKKGTLTGSRLKENHHDNKQFMPTDHFQIKDNGKPIPIAVESTKSFQQLQLTPTTWTMPHPICFFGYPGQSSNMPLSPESAFYSSPSSMQYHGFPFQNPLHQGFSPNYMQVQANMPMPFMSRLNYAGNLPQSISQAIGPTGPAMPNTPIFSLNQQSTAMSQQPIANMPYFCGYMSLPTVHFPPISDTSQSDHSVDEAKDLPKESRKLPHEVGVITQHNPRKRSFADFLREFFQFFYLISVSHFSSLYNIFISSYLNYFNYYTSLPCIKSDIIKKKNVIFI